MAQNQLLNWKNCQKCNSTKKKIDLFDFTSFFFAWTFLNFLARCDIVLKIALFFTISIDHCALGTSMRTRHESIGTTHSEEGTKEASSERLHKAGSLISMTSQVINIYSI